MEKKKFKMPHSYVIIFMLLIFVSIMTYLIPAHEYDREKNEAGNTTVIVESYHEVEGEPVPVWKIPNFVMKGLSKQADIIFPLIVIAGCLEVILSTGMFHAYCGKMAMKCKGKEKIFIPAILLIFAFIGITQSTNKFIGFAPLGVMLAATLGYDAIVGVAIVLLGVGIGFSTGILAPTTAVAQDLAELPAYSGMKFREHADKLGVEFAKDTVLKIETADLADENEVLEAAEAGAGHPPVIRQVVGKKETRLAKAVIIASGAHHRKLGIPGEAEFTGKGVSYCATCDGAFFRKKITAVVGGGDVALEDAIFLARLCEKVYVIHRRDEFRGAKSLQKRLMELPNVEILWDTVPEEICGTEKVETLKLLNKKTGEKRDLAVDGVFVAVGITPNSEAFKGSVDMDPAGYIAAGEGGKTNVPGIFAAGDVRTKALRQVVTAVADGANCVASVEQYLYGIE